MAEITEDTALLQAVEGDKEAFSELYERYVGRIYNYVLYRTGNPSDAEDITSRVFQRALRHIEHYQFQGVPFSAWLYRIATTWLPTGTAITADGRKYRLKIIFNGL